jgi:type IV secretion system protein VirD4
LAKQRAKRIRRTLLTHLGEAGMLLVGQTGSGKTLQMIANALTYRGSLIQIDIGGDIARATHRFRRDCLGQRTHVIDPFSVTGKPKARLDPLARFSLNNVEIESGAEQLAAIILAEQRAKTNDIFWPNMGGQCLAGDIAHAVRSTPPEKRTIQQVVDWIYSDDVAYTHAVLLDTVVPKGSFEAASMASWLQLPDSNNSGTRACVIATVHAAISTFRSQAIRSSLGPSTIDLNDLVYGIPTTVYLVLPIEQVYAMSTVLKLWLDTLLQPLLRRTRSFDPATLVVCDETAQLGHIPSLLTLATYGRNRSTRLWTAWQDSGQIQSIYGPDFSTLVNNCSALMFNAGNHLAARELANLAGVPLDLIASLKRGQQLVVETGAGSRVIQIPRYYTDQFFKGRFDPLPRFELPRTRAPSR